MDELLPEDHEWQEPKDVFCELQNGYVVVRLDKHEYGLVDQPVKYAGKTFEPKRKLHITIVSRDAAAALQDYLQRQPGEENTVRELIHNTDWDYRKRERFYYIRESEEVESIIQLVDVEGLTAFYRRLRQVTGTQLEKPPTHVTLYWRGDPKGIGLPTQAELERLAQAEVQPEELSW